MTDKPDGETPTSTASKAGKGRNRPQPVVDLPPGAVTEIVAEAPVAAQTPDSAAQATPQEPEDPARAAEPLTAALPPSPSSPPLGATRPGIALPVLAGLAAGLLGGAAVTQILPKMSGAAPNTDPALVGRVAQLEQQARAVKPGETVPAPVTQKLQQVESLLVEMTRREAAARAEIAALRQAVESRPAPLASAPTVPAAEFEAVKTRIGSIEDGFKAVPQGVNQLGARIDQIQPRIELVARDLQALASRMSGLGARDTLSSANARLAAVTLAEEAFAKGQPLASSLDLLKGLLPDVAALAPLQPFSEVGPASPVDLVKSLKAAAPKEPAPAAGSLSLTERVKQSALSFVEIRKTGDVSGADDQSALRRAEQALLRGDLAAALAATAQLSTQAAGPYAAWREKLERQVKAREALAALRQEAMAFLARTAQAAR